MRRLAALFAMAMFVLPGTSFAHGINGHVWVSDRGLVHLNDCDPELQRLLDDPEARNAYRFGAAFPDSGYATSAGREYGEAAHWEPFLQKMIEDWRARFAGDRGTMAARQYAAFILGVAQHGLEDELFDSLYMRRAAELGEDEDLIDTGTDFVLVEDGVADVRPTPWFPDGITNVYAAYGITVDVETIQRGIFAVDKVVLGLQDSRPAGLADEYRAALTWATAHILDVTTPGAHAWEQQFVGPYVEQLWLRLTRSPQQLAQRDPLIGVVPVSDGVVAATAAVTIRSWVTLVLGVGVRVGDLAHTVEVRDEAGDTVAVEVRGSRWAGQDDDYTRLIQIAPQGAWIPGGRYRVTVSSALSTIDGVALATPIRTTFSVCDGAACAIDPGRARSDAFFCDVSTGGGCAVGDNASALVGAWLLLPALWLWRRR